LYLAAGTSVLAVMGIALHAWSRDDPDPPPPPDVVCHAGAYRDASGRLVTLTPSEGGLRYRLETGESGRLTRQADGRWTATRGWTDDGPPAAVARIGSCDALNIEFGLEGEPLVTAAREVFRVREAKFQSRGVRLAGRLVMPTGDGPVPLVVVLHGSEDYSGRLYYPEQHRLPAQGIAVFVYDKRGTGDSGGEYTQDFYLLAADAAAALDEARRLAGARAARVGFVGGSQAGWIAPLAATQAPVDFVLVGYGMAEGPLAEDAGEVRQSLVDRGYGPDVLAQAREITDAAGRVMASGYREGFEALAAAKTKYRDEPWYGKIQGEFTEDFLRYPNWVIRVLGPFYDQDTSWAYDPMPTLRQVSAPQLWILAAEDREAPHEETLRRLGMLQSEGRSIVTAVFPDTDHGILEFEVRDGERVYTRYAEGYFPMMVEWIRSGTVTGSYGRSEIVPAVTPLRTAALSTG
jgi:dipeptidyl aminopeptidase/acylaminoacyl peptidase